ncbi:hypothetical protein X797_012376 [Metarhizium robertsii]|uniref:Uncharacterized protein n=2 Tax=Metarhizium robertsii TaxID=568076 RepID=E9EK14_METRA|nr:uncharacterized protein MAA_00099 [Metarhizium robertsii ARSEF 23]EFZ03025.1 hypothetical protein MAA_00099 [Metarhizium robertsii ARSEF 23]EXU94553.1 hypothetical protein X797_012376 [Metarhizium robertsii]
MLLSNTALLLLSVMQPALGQATAGCGSEELMFKQLTPEQVTLAYNVKSTGCDAGVRTWVGVWDAYAPLPLISNFKAWQYLEGNKGEVNFSKTELGSGVWKAGFFCDDGWRTLFALSGNFELTPNGSGNS